MAQGQSFIKVLSGYIDDNLPQEAYGAQETAQKVKKSTNGNVFPFPWTQRQNRRPMQSQAETLKNMNFMTEVNLGNLKITF